MTFSVTGKAAWAERTAGDVQEVAQKDGSIVVVPVASIEQHGDHLPVGTDSLLVTAVTQSATEDTDIPLLVTPTIWTGHSPHHRVFGGTISLSAPDFLEHISTVAESAVTAGFDAVILVNGHGGNISLVGAATGTVGPDHPEAQVLGVTYFQLATDQVMELRDSEIGGMAHGGEFETSLMLHLHPELVDVEADEGTMMDEPYELGTKDLVKGGPLSLYRPFDEYSDTGAIGDTTLASAEKGEQLLGILGEALADVFADIHEQNR